MSFLNLNGKIVADDKPVLMASNRSYRYGDGLFETMKVKNAKIELSALHFQRLFSSLKLLNYTIPSLFSMEKLENEIISLCQKNGCDRSARVRLSVFRGNGGIYDENKSLQYIIECWPLSKTLDQLNENGLVIDIYSEARKSVDKFSTIKSANFLPYSIAAMYAKENQLNDCLVLNTNGNIADSTIANLFLVTSEGIKTPGLSEGCINGVMRRYLVEKCIEAGLAISESVISIEDVENAEEVFLTNAIYGIRWVKQFRNSNFRNEKTIEIYNKFVRTFHT